MPTVPTIDVWLNAAAAGPYRIEEQWSDERSLALTERVHDAATSPSSVMLTSLGLLLTMAESNAREGRTTFDDKAAFALGELRMARQIVQALNLQEEAHAFNQAMAEPENGVLLGAIHSAEGAGGLSMVQLRALGAFDAFTLRRRLQNLCELGVLQTQGESTTYVLSEDAEHAWSRRGS